MPRESDLTPPPQTDTEEEGNFGWTALSDAWPFNVAVEWDGGGAEHGGDVVLAVATTTTSGNGTDFVTGGVLGLVENRWNGS